MVGQQAGRFEPEFSAMCGLETGAPEAWAELGTLTPPGQTVALFMPALLNAPPSWKRVTQFGPVQMVQQRAREALQGPAGFVARPLTPRDAPAMLELVALTRPGPFGPRTGELGVYLGLWDESGPGSPRLAAMTGQRAQTPAACEVSAVCTHPDYRRRGLARALVSQVAAHTHASGLIPFLHADPDNAAAQATYLGLGFVLRQPMWVSVMRRGETSTPEVSIP